VCGYEGTEDSVNLVFYRLGIAGSRYVGKLHQERRFHFRKPRQHEPSQAPEFAGSRVPSAALVLDNPVESKQVHCRRVWVYFDLKASFLQGLHRGAVPETSIFQKATEGNDVRREWPAKVGRIASGVVSPEVSIQLAFRRPDARLVSDNQGSIHSGHRVATPGLGMNPVDYLACTHQARDTPEV
jgi:hypothetical protein